MFFQHVSYITAAGLQGVCYLRSDHSDILVVCLCLLFLIFDLSTHTHKHTVVSLTRNADRALSDLQKKVSSFNLNE